MAEEGAEWHHQPNFIQGDKYILVLEVQTIDHQIYGIMTQSPRTEDVELALKDLTNSISASSPGNIRSTRQRV